MKTLSDRYRPVTQAECDHANTLREYEAAHKIWMNTSVFTEAGRIAKANKDAAAMRYEAALEAKRKAERLADLNALDAAPHAEHWNH